MLKDVGVEVPKSLETRSKCSMQPSVYVVLHISVITQDGCTALMLAAQWDRVGAVVELVKSGADLNLQDTVCHMLHTTCVLI